MNDSSTRTEAVELLQQLGLKEYEAKTFVALTRRKRGTAKDISETSEVPRTRVYDSIDVLESKGIVETQHGTPQEFRAVSIDEAVGILESEYETRTKELRSALRGLTRTDDGAEEVTHEVWSLSGESGITSRARKLIDGASEEVVLVVGHESVFTDDLARTLASAAERGVDVVVGTVSADLRGAVSSALPDIEVFVSELDWLRHSELPGDDTEISRLLLVDREAILVSTFVGGEGDERRDEHAVFGRGFDNGFVAIVRRLMATGLVAVDDPGKRN